MYDLTAFQRDLLFVLAGMEEPKGLEVKEKLEGYYQDDIHHARLYMNLDKLADMGLVQKGSIDDRTNYYSVSRRGFREIRDRQDWEEEMLEEVKKAMA